MNSKTCIVVMLFGAAVSTGCSSIENWYEARCAAQRLVREKDFKRLAALPPADEVKCSDQYLAGCAKRSRDLFNMAQSKMCAYVAFVETSREYTGFMNDVDLCIKAEKLSRADACAKVKKAVMAADVKLPADEKAWPRIQRGCDAVKVLGSDDVVKQIVTMNSCYLEIRKKIDDYLRQREKVNKYLERAMKAALAQKRVSEAKRHAVELEKNKAELNECEKESDAILGQLSEASSCILFMQEQHQRVVKLEEYSKK